MNIFQQWFLIVIFLSKGFFKSSSLDAPFCSTKRLPPKSRKAFKLIFSHLQLFSITWEYTYLYISQVHFMCCLVLFFFNSFLRTEKIWMLLRFFFLFFLDLEVIFIRVLNGSWEYNWSVCLGSGVQTKTMKKIFLYVNWKWMVFFQFIKKAPRV